MKKFKFLLILLSSILASCDFVFTFNKNQQNNQNNNENTEENSDNNSGNNDSQNQGQNQGDNTGGNTTTSNYTSTWPSSWQQYVVTYLNGMVPCYLNANKKCLFTDFETGCIDQSNIPYFNPMVKNTSPSINYEHDYGQILSDAGFKSLGTDVDEDGITVHYYEKGYCEVQFSKYKGDDNIYYFDVYAYYDYTSTEVFPNEYDIQYDNADLALKNKYDSNNKTVSISKWSITLKDVMKQSGSIQLKKDTGKITISGATKGIYIEFVRNADAGFVKAGTSSSNAKYIFNEGGIFKFPENTTYVEISAQSRVVEIEFFDIGY